jgi:SAM-dependent methyltransferase
LSDDGEASALNLLDIVQRDPNPQPWTDEKIPWDDPDFSRRMLAEHLSQAHDAASRRAATIDRHVDWLHWDVLGKRPSLVLDLGCGPGLYTSRLARLGHRCTGIDFGPASIAHAREQAESEGLACEYIQDDVRRASFDGGHDLILFIFGEFNVFRPGEMADVLRRCWAALAERGTLLLEVHTATSIRVAGQRPPRWRTAVSGLFSDRPYLVLEEARWHEQQQAAVERYYVVDAATGAVSRYGSTMQAYSQEGYEAMLDAAGYGRWEWRSGWPGVEPDEDFKLLLAWAE